MAHFTVLMHRDAPAVLNKWVLGAQREASMTIVSIIQILNLATALEASMMTTDNETNRRSVNSSRQDIAQN